MILKYFYNDGWNYVDGIKEVKVIYKSYTDIGVCEQNYEPKENEHILITKFNQFVTQISANTTLFEGVGFDYARYDISLDYIRDVFDKGLNPNVKIALCRFEKETWLLAFDGKGYLLNDSGKTIESI